MKKSKIHPTKHNPLGDKPVKDLSEMEEILHQFTIMREHMDSKIAILAEAMQGGFETLNRRIDGLEYAMNVMRSDVNGLGAKLMILDIKLDKALLHLDNHEERITNLETAIN